MTALWTPTALRDLESLAQFIAEDAPGAAANMVARVLSGIEALKRQPGMGGSGRIAARRELIIAPYIVACRATRDAIELLAIIHGASRRPDSF